MPAWQWAARCATTPVHAFAQPGAGAIAADSSGRLYAVSGADGAWYDGTAWHALTGLAGRALAGDQQGGIWGVGLDGLIVRASGATVGRLDQEATKQALRRAIETKSGPIALGQQGALLFRSPQGLWQPAPFPPIATVATFDLWAKDQQQVYVAGVNGGLLLGQAGSFAQLTSVQTLAVWGDGNGQVYLGQPKGGLSRYDSANGTSNSLPSTLSGNVFALDGLSSGALYLAAETQLGRYDGSTATALWTSTLAGLQSVSAVNQGVVAVGSGGFIVTCKLGLCGIVEQRPEQLSGVAARSLDDFYVVTKDASCLHYVSGALTETLPLPMTEAFDVTVDGQGTLRVYGSGGSIVVRAP